ncbi:EF-hand domain-containing protein [Hydrogenophaga bisanensis]|uniref:EF-hand domain-containing protein n=1 Tax=Hydrogenophaga bisanensis TaxID=439611 RepID=A0ABW2RBX5_9BURK
MRTFRRPQASAANLTPSRFERHSVALLAVWTLTLAPGLAGATQPRAVDLAEAISAAFDRADRDGDGHLSPQEAEHLPAVAQRFTALDRDGDGKLSRKEFHQGIKGS